MRASSSSAGTENGSHGTAATRVQPTKAERPDAANSLQRAVRGPFGLRIRRDYTPRAVDRRHNEVRNVPRKLGGQGFESPRSTTRRNRPNLTSFWRFPARPRGRGVRGHTGATEFIDRRVDRPADGLRIAHTALFVRQVNQGKE